MSPASLRLEESLALENYQAAMQFYIWAVTELSNHSESLSGEEFARLRTTVDYALERYQESRWQLELARQRLS
jgi:hypothetical protein